MTPTLLCAVLLCMTDAGGATPVALEFKDAAARDKRQVVTYRALEFRDTPVRPLGEGRTFEAGAQYAVVPVGPKPETALTIVWLPKAAGGAVLWLDANADGKLADDERHAVTGRDIEIPATITIELDPKPQKVQRTLLFRRSTLNDGLRFAVRGYVEGRVRLGDKEYPVFISDANATGTFDNVGYDRVSIDLNGDGRFDPLVEQFPLGKPIVHCGNTYVIRSNAAASEVVANLRSAGEGKLRLALAKHVADAKVSAELISDLGELVSIDKLDAAIPVPFGEYRLSALKLEAPTRPSRRGPIASTTTRRWNIQCPRARRQPSRCSGL